MHCIERLLRGHILDLVPENSEMQKHRDMNGYMFFSLVIFLRVIVIVVKPACVH